MPDEPTSSGGGLSGIMSKKVFGIPVPILGLGGAGLAYWYFKRKSAASAAAAAGQPCTDANGNPSVTDATGACTLAAVAQSDGSSSGDNSSVDDQAAEAAGTAAAAAESGANQDSKDYRSLEKWDKEAQHNDVEALRAQQREITANRKR